MIIPILKKTPFKIKIEKVFFNRMGENKQESLICYRFSHFLIIKPKKGQTYKEANEGKETLRGLSGALFRGILAILSQKV